MSSSEQQLLDELKNLFPNFTCTLQDLRNPTEEFVTNFYIFWLSEFEANISNIPQLQFSQTAVVCAHHDAYSSTIPKLNLLVSIRAFNVVPDFGMCDIVSPTPRRIQTVLRAFCEFFNFCDSRIATVMDLKKEKKVNERKQKLTHMVQEIQTLRQELNNVFRNIGQLQDSKKKLEEEVMDLQKIASDLRVAKEGLRTDSDEASGKIKEKEIVLQKLNKEESQVINKIKDYTNQIVDSPTMILGDLEKLRVKSEEVAKLSEQKRDMVESKMQTQDGLGKVLNLVEMTSLQLDEVFKVIEHHKKLLQVVSDIEKETVECQEQLEAMKSLLMCQTKKKGKRQEDLQALNLKWKTMKDQLTQSVEAAIRELNSQKDAKSKMMIGLKEDAEVEEKLASVMEKIKVSVDVFEEAYNKIMNKQNTYFETLKHGVESQMEKTKSEAEKRYGKKKNNK